MLNLIDITENTVRGRISVFSALKAPIKTAADDIHKYFFHCYSETIRLDVSSESSSKQRIHMKNQA